MVDQEASPDRRELENLLLFKDVDLEAIQGLLKNCSVREVKQGDVVIHAGQPNRFLYLLLSGRLRVHLKLALDPIAVLEPGEVVGEISLIDGQLTTAYVVAHADCRLLVIDEKVMWSLVDSSHAVARNLLFVIARRLRHGNTLIMSSQQLERDYERYAVVDALTGVYNLRWLKNILGRHIERSRKGGWAFSLLLFDVDDFKRYNEANGSLAGDRVLYTTARTLRERMRPGEMIVRYGGDEFIVLLPDTDVSKGQQVSDRVRQALSETRIYSADKNPLPSITVSVGVAQMTADDTPDALIEAADAALTYARERGGNQVFAAARPS
ncbi:MAG: diguanylate cyclase [Acidobacteriota bacterium]